jgi:predicted dehydrogenase
VLSHCCCKEAQIMLNAAVVGLGWWGKHIVVALAGSRHIRVTHAVEVAPEGVAQFARAHALQLTSSLEPVLEHSQVDTVIVATPHSLHEAQVLQAVAAGKQVFCEKPLALTAASAQRMLSACDAAGIVLGIGHERRFEPAMEHLLQTITGGELGQLLHLEANVSHNLFASLDPSSWRVRASDAPAGAMTALGIHLTDLFISFAGRPTSVAAKTAKVLQSMAGDDHVSAQIEFASGATAALTCLSSTPFHGRIAAYGTRGWVEVRENGNVDKSLPTEVVIADAQGRRTGVSHAATNTVLANFESWARAVGGHGTYRFTREQLLDNIRVLEAIVTSAAAGSKPIALS